MGFTRIATIIFPTIITLWVAGMSVLMWRKGVLLLNRTRASENTPSRHLGE